MKIIKCSIEKRENSIHKCYSNFGIKFKFNFLKFCNNNIVLIKNKKKYKLSPNQAKKKLGINVVFEGLNNHLTIVDPCEISGSEFIFRYNNNYVMLCGNNRILLKCICHNNSKISIKKNTTMQSTRIHAYNNNIEIGEDCLFSSNIEIDGGAHAVYDNTTGEVLNFPTKPISIGDHVWCGRYAFFTSKATIKNNCIVANNAVVCKPFDEDNVLIAGNPAQIKKRNINWSRHEPTVYKKLIDENKGARNRNANT